MSADLTWPSDRMARMIDVTPRRLNQLSAEGVLPREERGRWNPIKVTVAYIRYLRDRKDPGTSEENGETEAQARKALNVARRQQIELEMEVLRGDRIPLEVIGKITSEAESQAAGILKAHKGKKLDQEVLDDVFKAFRESAAKLSQWAKEHQTGATN